MFERKLTETSIEPAENKSLISVDVCTIAWTDSFARRRSRQTVINFSASHGANSGIIFTYSFFELA